MLDFFRLHIGQVRDADAPLERRRPKMNGEGPRWMRNKFLHSVRERQLERLRLQVRGDPRKEDFVDDSRHAFSSESPWVDSPLRVLLPPIFYD